jgi:nitroreductase
MMKNELFELAAKRRSIRRYTKEHIDDAILNEIMKVALTAPCSFGHRPVEFVIVRDKNRIKELAACKSLGGSQIIGADAVIVVMVKLERGEFWIEDGAIASGYILLAAEQYDVGACWVHIRNRKGKKKTSDEEVRNLLGVSDGYAVLNLIALGGKGEKKDGYTEDDLDFGKVHQETF